MVGSSRVGGASSSSNLPHSQETRDGQPPPPPTFVRTRSSSDPGTRDEPASSAKRSRTTGSFGASARQTTTIPTQAMGNSSVPTHTPVLVPHVAQPTVQTPAGVFPGASGPVPPSRNDHSMLALLNEPLAMFEAQLPSRLNSLAGPLGTPVASNMQQPNPPLGIVDGDSLLCSMLTKPYANVDLQQLQLRSLDPSFATPFPPSAGLQGGTPTVQIAPVTTMQPTLPPVQSALPPSLDPGLGAHDLESRDMMDAYLPVASMGRIPVPTAQDLMQNFSSTGLGNPVGSPPSPAIDPDPGNLPGI